MKIVSKFDSKNGAKVIIGTSENTALKQIDFIKQLFFSTTHQAIQTTT